jgi:hypothetical protein
MFLTAPTSTVVPIFETSIAVRGAFDGGVSAIGSDGGWWLDGEFASNAIEIIKDYFSFHYI